MALYKYVFYDYVSGAVAIVLTFTFYLYRQTDAQTPPDGIARYA